MNPNKLALAVAAGAFTTTLVGGVALAGFQPFPTTGESAVPASAAGLVQRDDPKNKLKSVLDALVAKGTLTQAQEDAILQAVQAADPAPKKPAGPTLPKPAHPTVPSIKSFLGALEHAAVGYLGIDQKALVTELRAGKSFADIANGLSAQGKSATGLIDVLTKATNAKIDAAVGSGKLTADQAATLKAKVASEITAFVARKMTKPVAPIRPPKPKS